MQRGMVDHVWSIGELIDPALDGELPSDAGRKVPTNQPPPKPKGWRTFTIIRGGKRETFRPATRWHKVCGFTVIEGDAKP